MNIVDAFEFAWCVYDSGYDVKSLHKTKRGAYKAMMKHKWEHWYADRDLGVTLEETGFMERWRIREYLVGD